MSKFGFNENEIRKTITDEIDKDGFHRETVVMHEKSPKPITFPSGPSRKAVDGQTRSLHEIGMSRHLDDDEDYVIYDQSDVNSVYLLRPLEYIPDIPSLVFNEGISISDTSEFNNTTYPCFIQFYTLVGQDHQRIYVFVYKKDSRKIVGSNYSPNEESRKIWAGSEYNFYPSLDFREDYSYGGGSSIKLKSPLLLNERIVYIPDDSVTKYEIGDTLPESCIETVLDIEGSYVSGSSASYRALPVETSGLSARQGIWIVVADDKNTIIDCLHSTINYL